MASKKTLLLAAAGTLLGIGSYLFIRNAADDNREALTDTLPDPLGEAPPDKSDIIPESPYTEPPALTIKAGAGLPFSGEIHPELASSSPIALTAHWSQLPRDTMRMDEDKAMLDIYGSLSPVEKVREVSPELLSGFFPAGELSEHPIWAVDMERTRRILTQFDPNPNTQLRNGGPNGGFALVQAENEDYWLIHARTHAEFELAPKNYYTPAYFQVQLLLHKKTDTVEYFRLSIPTKHGLNVDMNGADNRVDIRQVSQMELVGGDEGRLTAIHWEKYTPKEETEKILQRAFYRFMEIDWVHVDEAVARAKENNKPLNIIMLWGVLDDQSC
jgi:hypothetical protein